MDQTLFPSLRSGANNHLSRRTLLQASASVAATTVVSGVLAAEPSVPDAPVTPFRVKVSAADVKDLRARLSDIRWPPAETVGDESQGVPLARMKALTEYWANRYDWRRLEARLTKLPQFRTEIDGLGIHFVHVKSRHANAAPLLLTHGWPGSFIEFLDVIGPLTDPTARGGKPEDAFHVVIPSLPGYGFSDKPSAPGWNVQRVAKAWGVLMQRLGYSRWFAQGGDWGGGVTTWMGKLQLPGLAAMHLNLPILFPPPIEGEMDAQEKATVDQLVKYDSQLSGYAKLQATRPQTIGYALDDSPVGLAAWIYEKFIEWTDSNGNPESVLSKDAMLDNISLYWFTRTGTSSARLYRESFGKDFTTQKVDIPVAVSVFPGELYRPLKKWGERVYSKLIYWNEAPRGGHFAAFEQPDIFVTEVRRAFALGR